MKHFTKIVCGILALVSLMLAGCSSNPKLPLVPADITNPAKAYGWDLSGKILIKTPDDKLSSHLYWLHTPKLDEMKLTSMLGTSILSMSASPKLSKLEVNGDSFTDTDAEHLLAQLTGWTVPVKQLPLWITGQFPYANVLAKDSLGRPTQVVSYDPLPWHININSWQLDNPLLPKLLLITKGSLMLKIQVNHWQALQPANQPLTNQQLTNQDSNSTIAR